MAILLIPATIILEAYDFLLYDLIPYSFSNICVLLIKLFLHEISVLTFHSFWHIFYLQLKLVL